MGNEPPPDRRYYSRSGNDSILPNRQGMFTTSTRILEMSLQELILKAALPILGLVMLIRRLEARRKRGGPTTPVDRKLERADGYYFRGVTIVFLCIIPFVLALGFEWSMWITYSIMGVGIVGLAHVFIGSYLKADAGQG